MSNREIKIYNPREAALQLQLERRAQEAKEKVAKQKKESRQELFHHIISFYEPKAIEQESPITAAPLVEEAQDLDGNFIFPRILEDTAPVGDELSQETTADMTLALKSDKEIARDLKRAARAEKEHDKLPKILKKTLTLRYCAAALILIVAGYLAIDTYLVNRHTEAIFKGEETSGLQVDSTTDVNEIPISNEQKTSYQVPALDPRYLKINSIGVNARVLNVGLKENTIGTPRNIFDTGWYNGSAYPGESGAIFIDGHLSGPTQNGVFSGLAKLKPGDQIQIVRGDNKIFTYEVRMSETVNVANVDMKKVLSTYNGETQGLNLMTCAGNYNTEENTYNERTIVYSVLK